MNQETNGLLFQNRVFTWIGLATCAILFVPLIAMRFTTEVDWGLSDFIAMGSLLFCIASLFVLVARRVPVKLRLVTGGIFVAAFIYIWAELAVGIFTDLGS